VVLVQIAAVGSISKKEIVTLLVLDDDAAITCEICGADEGIIVVITQRAASDIGNLDFAASRDGIGRRIDDLNSVRNGIHAWRGWIGVDKSVNALG